MPSPAHYFSSEKHEEILRANLYSTIKVKDKRNKEDTNDKSMMTSMVTIACGDGGLVEVDRLLLVLLSPFYRNIFTQEDVSIVILPDVSLFQLSADFFNMLHQLSESSVNPEESEYRKCGLKEEIKLDSHFWMEDSNCNNISGDSGNDYKKCFPELTECETILHDEDDQVVGVTAPDTDTDTNYSPSLKQPKKSESNKIKRSISGKKKGLTTCAKCDKQHSNRTVPPRCECGYDLGEKFIKTSKFNNKTYNRIIKRKKSRGDEFDVKVLCNQCGKIFRNNKQLRSHMPTCSIDKFPCDCDLAKNLNYRDRARHVKAFHLGWATCPHSGCNKQLENDVAVAAHIEIQHNNGDGFECETCGETHISKALLQYHIDAHHKEKKFQCDKCLKSFIVQSRLKYHQREVHDGGIVCHICSKTVKCIRKHVLTVHTDDSEKKYKCNLCPKGFADKQKLKCHEMNVHIKSRPYHCNFEGCSMSFNDLSNRNTHQKKVHGNLLLTLKPR